MALSGIFSLKRHTKGDKDGRKAERPNIREINKGQFTKHESISSLYATLFGNKDYK